MNIIIRAIIGNHGSGKTSYFKLQVKKTANEGFPNYYFIIDPCKQIGIRKWEEPNHLECRAVVFDHAYSESSDIQEQILAAAKWCEKHDKQLYITAVMRSDVDFLCQKFSCEIRETTIDALVAQTGATADEIIDEVKEA